MRRQTKYRRKLEAKRQEQGICMMCGKSPINTERSKRSCSSCLDLLCDRDKKRYAEGKREGSSSYAVEAFKLAAIEAGFCRVHTSRKRDGESKIHCLECCKRRAANSKRMRERKATAQGRELRKRGTHRETYTREAKIRVTEHDGGWFRAQRGKDAWWGRTAEEAIERLERKTQQ